MRKVCTVSGFALALASSTLGFGCMRPGSVPMAGHRNMSTACLFGLRGVRVAMDDSDLDAVDVTIRMSADARGLQHCARSLLNGQEAPASETLLEQPAPEKLEISHQLATAQVENIPGGVRIHIVPDKTSDTEVIRDELAARIERASNENRCD
jgi:hypothetical protein